MVHLLQIDGAIEFFLETASLNVKWEGSSTDIKRDKLITVAAAVNRQFGTHLDCLDIKLTWAKLRTPWETWVRSTHYLPSKKVNSTTGEINIDDFAWDQLVRVVLFSFLLKLLFHHYLFLFLICSLLLFFSFFFFFHVFCFAFMFMFSWKQIQNSRMNPNRTIEKNKVSKIGKMKNFAFCLVWMVRCLLFLLFGLLGGRDDYFSLSEWFKERERERGSNIRMVVCSAEDAVPFLFKIII